MTASERETFADFAPSIMREPVIGTINLIQNAPLSDEFKEQFLVTFSDYFNEMDRRVEMVVEKGECKDMVAAARILKWAASAQGKE